MGRWRLFAVVQLLEIMTCRFNLLVSLDTCSVLPRMVGLMNIELEGREAGNITGTALVLVQMDSLSRKTN
jgi:hypothetical protein